MCRAVTCAGAIVCAALVLAATPTPSLAENTSIDAGRLVVSLNGKPFRIEEFNLDQLGDSLIVTSNSWLVTSPALSQVDWIVDSTTRTISYDKGMTLVLSAFDYALKEYWSAAAAGPDTMRRAITLGGLDTAYTAYREINGAGVGEQLMLPPGRIFILDPPLFTTFTLIARSLKGRTFDSRPITMMVLAPRDSVVAVTVTDLGNETIRWGARPVVARKLRIADLKTAFTAWVAQDGRLLRLQQPEAGIVVERQAPKTPPARRRPPGTK